MAVAVMSIQDQVQAALAASPAYQSLQDLVRQQGAAVDRVRALQLERIKLAELRGIRADADVESRLLEIPAEAAAAQSTADGLTPSIRTALDAAAVEVVAGLHLDAMLDRMRPALVAVADAMLEYSDTVGALQRAGLRMPADLARRPDAEVIAALLPAVRALRRLARGVSDGV